MHIFSNDLAVLNWVQVLLCLEICLDAHRWVTVLSELPAHIHSYPGPAIHVGCNSQEQIGVSLPNTLQIHVFLCAQHAFE